MSKVSGDTLREGLAGERGACVQLSRHVCPLDVWRLQGACCLPTA